MDMSAEIVWLIIGILLVFSEFLIPGLVIGFFGIGAILTGLLTWLGITVSIHTQLLSFTLTSLLMLIFLRKYFSRVFQGKEVEGTEGVNFNIQIGKIIPVTELIEPGEVGGRVRYQGTIWKAKANERIAPGESVVITGCDNITLLVEKTNKED